MNPNLEKTKNSEIESYCTVLGYVHRAQSLEKQTCDPALREVVCGLDSAHFAHGLAQQVAFKKEQKLDPLTDIGVINGRKRYQGWNMLFYSLICKRFYFDKN